MGSGTVKTEGSPASADSLIERLVNRGWEFDFFPAVWLLERFAARGTPAVGKLGPVSAERFRFRPDTSMAFPATDVRRVAVWDALSGVGSVYQVDVTFMGLYGVATPLPLHYAVDVLRSVEQPPPRGTGATPEPTPSADEGGAAGSPLRDFLDLFHHRLISFFYRSWLKYRFERSFALSALDDVAGYLLWFIGCAPGVDRETLGVAPLRLVRYAGLLTQRPRSAISLAGMLRDYWEDPSIRVESCVGRWVRVARADQNRLGEANSSLGSNVTIGEHVYDLNGTFIVRIGPMDWERYVSLLPDGTRSAETRALIRYYCMDPLAWTVELTLRAGEAPATRIASGESAGRLGYTSWLRTGELPEVAVQFPDGAAVRAEAA